MKNSLEKNSLQKNSVLKSRGKFVHPADEESARAAAAFCRLFELVRILRSPQGCPWDREQTPLSMRSDLQEEVFEAVLAISENAAHAKEELGDVLLNATMISYMYSQKKRANEDGFFLEEMFDSLCEKLIRRHPHVFEKSQGKAVATKGGAKTSGQVLSQWERIKENVEGRKKNSILDQVPKKFPPLLRAFKMQKKAAKKGFDWKSVEPVREKILEEFREVLEAEKLVQKIEKKFAKENSSNENRKKNSEKKPANKIAKNSEQKNFANENEKASAKNAEQKNAALHLEEEIGDLLFAVANYARKLGVDPSLALNAANKKFYKRFSHVEKKCAEQGVEMTEANLQKMDEFWNEAKTAERG